MNKGLTSDNSSALSNIFKANTIRYIKVLVLLLFLITVALIILEFLLSNQHKLKLKNTIEYLQNSFIILTDMVYSKYYVTEGIIASELKSYYPYEMDKREFYENIKNELTFYRQEFTQKYDIFSSKELSQDLKNFLTNTHINISTMTINDIPETIELVLNSAMNRIPSSINDLSSNIELITIKNRDSYELMHNLLNEYYINWNKSIDILLNDSINLTNFRLLDIIYLILYFFISSILIIVLLKLLSIFSLDREKPINLFLTLKKRVFENLKVAAENFSNKLLNKFFGNEDNEEESQQEYQSNIQANDINIVKYKAANQYNSSIQKALTFMKIIVIIFLFILINLIYFIVKYFLSRYRKDKIHKFILLYEKNNLAQNHFIFDLDVFKSYLYNDSIPILNNENTKEAFLNVFLNISETFEESIIFTSKTSSFLSGKYLEKYEQYLHSDYSELIPQEYYNKYKPYLENKVKNGLKPIETRLFEIVRYFTIKYCDKNKLHDKNNNGISDILEENDSKLYEMNLLIQYTVKVWYKEVLNLMMDGFFDYYDSCKFFDIIFFICLIVVNILYYSIILKTYEEKLNVLLKKSSDLINLIPQEIKSIIIEKLNE